MKTRIRTHAPHQMTILKKDKSFKHIFISTFTLSLFIGLFFQSISIWVYAQFVSLTISIFGIRNIIWFIREYFFNKYGNKIIHIAVGLGGLLGGLTLPLIMYSETGNFFTSFIAGCIGTLLVSFIFWLSYINSEGYKKKKKKSIHIRHFQNGTLWLKYKNNQNFLNHHNYFSSKDIKGVFFRKYMKEIGQKVGVIFFFYISYLFLMLLSLGINGFMEEIISLSVPLGIIIVLMIITMILGHNKTDFYYHSLHPKSYHKHRNKRFFY